MNAGQKQHLGESVFRHVSGILSAKDIDPRVKALLFFALLPLFLSTKSLNFLVISVLTGFLMVLTSGLFNLKFLLRLFEPMLIAVMLIFIKGWTEPGQKVFLFFSSEGLISGLFLALRILASVVWMLLITMSSKLDGLMRTLIWLRFPSFFLDTVLLSYRYLFILLEDASTIYQCQKNRLGYSSLKRTLNSAGILAGCMLINSFDRAVQAALAMKLRGYSGSVDRISFEPLGLRSSGYALIVFLCILTIYMFT